MRQEHMLQGFHSQEVRGQEKPTSGDGVGQRFALGGRRARAGGASEHRPWPAHRPWSRKRPAISVLQPRAGEHAKGARCDTLVKGSSGRFK